MTSFSITTASITTSFALAMTSLLAVTSAHADTSSVDDTHKMQPPGRPVEAKPIVITGEKIDKHLQDTVSAITVFNDQAVANGEYDDVKALATSASNVVTDSFGNIAMRGITGNGAATGGLAFITGARARIATIIDGTTQDWSGYNFTPNTLWDIEQIEVLRGPQSTTQGASAIAGALVVKTRDPSFENEAAVRTGLERYDNGNMKYNLAAMSSGALMKDELAYRLAFDGSTGEGWLNYHQQGYDTPNLSQSEHLNLRAKLLWEPLNIPALSAKLTTNYHKNKGEHASFASNTHQGMRTQTLTLNDTTRSRIQDSNANDIAADVEYELTPSLINSLHLSHSNADVHADEYPTLFNYDIDQKTTRLENRLLINPVHAELSGLFGLFIAQKEASLSTDQARLSTDYTTYTTAAYGEATYALSTRTKATLGLRVEHESIDKDGTAFGRDDVSQNSDNTYYLPKISLTHELFDSTTIGASIKQGYSPAGSGIDVTSNTAYDYDSEEVTSWELSSKSQFSNGTTLNSNLFYSDYNDYQAATGFAVGNVKSAHTFGLEVEAASWLTSNIELKGSIGLLQSEIDQDSQYKGNELSSAPKTNLGLGFSHYIDHHWSYGLDAHYVGSYYSDLSNSRASKVGDHTITNARLQYKWNDITVNGYIKNLTNEDAVYFRSGSLATVGQTRTLGISLLYRM
ncbi:TonB-dependent receptor [Terasakiispira papahanaumokuakeensis]|uniref:TonB-dependent receptor n=2 Tax=Terasakiispira papahanaumokuakeensis TaxID=197479 RepID=A0A1E2VDN1_9GAMM|nr:TonB-dependent receptor [Terasakiispira papahanaumokuakeensis]